MPSGRIVMRLSNFMFLSLFLVLFFAYGAANAGGQKGQTGIALSLTESSSILALTYLGKRQDTTIEPSFGLSSFNNSFRRYLPGIGFGYHLSSGKEFRPFFGTQEWHFDSPSLPMARRYGDILFGPSFGTQYFVNKHVSIAGEYGSKVHYYRQGLFSQFPPSRLIRRRNCWIPDCSILLLIRRQT